mgnify:CR=1 FL=1
MLTRKIVWPDFSDAKIESEVLKGNRVWIFIFIYFCNFSKQIFFNSHQFLRLQKRIQQQPS